MNFAIYRISDGLISRWITGPASEVGIQCAPGEEFYLSAPRTATHIVDNAAITITPVPTAEAQKLAITKAVQKFIDSAAQSHDYDNIVSLASYSVSTDPIFAAEGKAGVAWRDACWRYCCQMLAAVDAGTKTMPTPEEAVSGLPPMVWPIPSTK